LQSAIRPPPNRHLLLFMGRIPSLDIQAGGLGPGIESLYIYEAALHHINESTFGGLSGLRVLGLREVTFPAVNNNNEAAAATPFSVFHNKKLDLADLRLIGCNLGTVYGRLIRCTADHVELHANIMTLMAENAVQIESKGKLEVSRNRFLGEEWGVIRLTPLLNLTLDANSFEGNRSNMLK
jgi:hypothetical protein